MGGSKGKSAERTLVHIVNTEILKIWDQIGAFVFDLDGSLTDLHTPLIYNVMWESVLESLDKIARKSKSSTPKTLRRRLEGYSFVELGKNGYIPLGWALDMELGYLVLTDINNNIIGVRDGEKIFPRVKALSIYNFFKADTSQGANPDHQRPRFLMICSKLSP